MGILVIMCQNWLEAAQARWLSWLAWFCARRMLQVRTQVRAHTRGGWVNSWPGHMQEAANQCFSLTSISLSPATSLSLKSIKKKKKPQVRIKKKIG